MSWKAVTTVVLCLCAGLSFAETRTIAVLEFQNQAERIIPVSGWDVAAWAAVELKKEKFKPVDRKPVNAILKEAVWLEDRLRPEDESRLRALPADFALYGTIQKWQQEASVTTDRALDYRHPPSRTPAASVVFSFNLVDLSTGESVDTFLMDGSLIGNLIQQEERPEQPDLHDDTRYKELFEQAAKQALRKAAKKLALN